MDNPTLPTDKPWHLWAFFILAYAVSWSIGIPLALAHQGIIPAILSPWAHYLIAFGPMLAALIMTAIGQGMPGLQNLGKRMIRWACPKWLIFAFSPLIIGWLLIKISNGLTGDVLKMSDFGAVYFLPPLGMKALLLWIFTFGLGEETGWRGFALPRLQRNRSALGATLILAAMWALWHLPQFFYIFEPSITISVGWLISLFAGAVVLTWFYNSANNSILMVAIWHGCFNFVTATTTDTGFLPQVLSLFVILWAGFVIVRTKPKHLMSL
jgi:membrane protease YdiL (CAAX protease family)